MKKRPGLFAIVTFLILLLPQTSFANETIYTWGYGDIIAQVLNGTKWLVATGDFIGIFKIVALLSLVYVIVTYSGNLFTKADPFMLPKVYIVQLAVWSLFTVVKTDVAIIDRQNAAYDQVVTEVPIGVARPIAWFSLLQKVLGERMETVFSLPNDLKYTNSGFFSGIGALLQAGSQRIIDPYLYLSTNSYVVDCVVPDILDGTKNEGALMSSGTLWADLGNTNPARTTLVYDNANTNGTVENCLNAYTQISGRLNIYITDTGLPYAGASLGGYSALQLANVIGVASPYFLNYSATGEGFLLQSISMNHLREGYATWAAANGISQTGLGYGSGKAEETVRQNLALTGVLGSKYIPVIKGILTVILVTFIPILILLLLTPMMGVVALGFLFTLLWLSLWQLGDVILNLIINVKASHFLTVAAGGSYIIRSKEIVDASLLDYVNMAGSLYWMIPTMAAFVAGGFSFMALSSITGSSARSVYEPVGGASSEAATGSSSFGNSSHHNARANHRDWTSFLGTGSAARFSAASDHWDATRSHDSSSKRSGNFSSPLQTSSISASTPVGEGFAREFGQGFQGQVEVMQGTKRDTGEGAVYERGAAFRTEGGIFSAATDLIVAKDGKGAERILSGSIQGYAGGEERRFIVSAGQLVEASVSDGTRSEVYRGGKLVKSGVTDARSAEELRQEAAGAGMRNVAAAIAPGMEYQYTYGPDGGLVSAELKQGGQLLVRDEAESKAGTSGREILDREFSLGGMTFRPGTTIATYGTGSDRRTEVEGVATDGRSVHGVYAEGQWAWVDAKRGQEATLAVGKEELLSRAEALSRTGHPQAASGMREIASSLGSGENARIQEFRGPNGEWASSRIDHGGKTDWVDSSFRGREDTRKNINEDTETIRPGLMVEAPQGKYEMASGTIRREGGQIEIDGTSKGGERVHLKGFAEMVKRAGNETAAIRMAPTTGEIGKEMFRKNIDKSITDQMDVSRGGGTEVTMVTPEGVTTGYLAHDPTTDGPVLVFGDVRYGVGKHIVTQNPDGSLLYQDVQTDPKTGQVVTGRESSILVSEMAMKNPHDGRTYNVQILTDTKTGSQLAIDGKSGTFWKRTQYEGDMHIEEYRGYSQHGGVLSTMAERVIPGAGRWVGDVVQGTGEATTVFSPIKGMLKPGGTPTTSGKELNRDLKEWSEYFQKKGWKPEK